MHICIALHICTVCCIMEKLKQSEKKANAMEKLPKQTENFRKTCAFPKKDNGKSFVADFQKLPYFPVSFERGKGALLYDYDGKEYIDFLSSASTANIGHGNEEIAEAVYSQMNKITQYCCAYFPMPEEERLSKKLIELTGEDDMHAAYSNCGSEAIDCAMKLARAYTGRNRIISYKESYHGSTYGAMSISAISVNMRKNMGSLVPDAYHVGYPNCFRCKYSKNECGLKSRCAERMKESSDGFGAGLNGDSLKGENFNCLDELTEAFEQYIPPEEVAAIFIEPIGGDMGIVVPPKEYMQKLQELCRKYGILLVADEIQQGLCRTGKWFSYEHFGIKPDIIVLGKSVGGGLPMGVTLAKREIMQSLSAPAHVFTMSGHSAVCVAGLKQLEIFEREDMNEQVAQKGRYLKRKLFELAEKYDFVGQVRGEGLSLGVEIVDSRETRNRDCKAAAKISYRCMQNGLLLTFIGKNTLRIQPPLVITKEQLDRAVEILFAAFDSFARGEIDDSALSVAKGW